VPAGTYSLFTIPGQKEWTVVLNKDAKAGTREYKQEQDALRVTAKPAAAPARERLTFLFSNTTDTTASLDLEWEKVRVSLPIEVDTDAHAMANIKAATGSVWRVHANAARYLIETKKDYDGALALLEKSLALQEDFYNVFLKARAVAGKGRHKDAVALAQKAEELGRKAEIFFLEEEIKQAIAEWSKKK